MFGIQNNQFVYKEDQGDKKENITYELDFAPGVD